MENQLGKNIKALRTLKRYTRKELAKMLDVSEITIGNYENGLREPNIEKLTALADFFGVSIDSLIRGSDPSNINFSCSESKNGLKNGGVIVGHIPTDEVETYKKILPHFNTILNSICAAIPKIKKNESADITFSLSNK